MKPADLAGDIAPRTTVAAPSAALSALAIHNGGARVGRLAVLIATDLAALVFSGIAAWGLWALPMKEQPLGLYLSLVPLLSLFVLGYATAGLYPGFGLGPVETLRRCTYVTGFGYLVLAAFSFALKLDPLYSRVTFAIALVLSGCAVPIGRALVLHVAQRLRWWNE